MFEEIAAGVLGITGDIFGVGGTFQVERSHDLRGSDSVVLDALELAAPALLGATTLSLRAAGGGSLAGAAPAGLVVTVAGSPYALAADARADAGLLAVSLSSGLLAPASAGTAATPATSARFDLPGGIRNDDLRNLPPDLAPRVRFEVLVPTLTAPAGFKPRNGDIVRCPSGQTETLLSLLEPPGSWQLLCGKES